MKKIMIAVAIVCAATLAHASAYTWGLTSEEDKASDGSTYLTDTSFTLMLFTGTIGETLNSDGLTYTLSFSDATYVSQVSAPTGYQIGELSFDKNRTSDAVTGTAGQAFAILVLDTGAGITDYANYNGTYAIVTGTGVVMQDLESSVDYTKFTSGTAVTGGMYHTAAAIPEPTSGLLLLLGVAGLALKRRRA